MSENTVTLDPALEEIFTKIDGLSLGQAAQLVKAMELLTRARLVLVQNNLGLAQFDIQAGRKILANLQVEAPAHQTEQIARIVARLDAALDNLPAAREKIDVGSEGSLAAAS